MPSTQRVFDQLEQDLQYNKNEGAQALAYDSMAFRLVTDAERLSRLTGNSPQILARYTVLSLSEFAEELRQQILLKFKKPIINSRVWNNQLFVTADDTISIKAIFWQWVRYSMLRAGCLQFYMFMQFSNANPSPRIVTLLDLIEAASGFQEFVEMFFGWVGVMRAFIDQISAGDFDHFDVNYILSELHNALCMLGTLAVETARTKPVEQLPSSTYANLFVQAVAAVRTKLTWEGSETFRKYTARMPGGVPSQTASPAAAKQTKLTTEEKAKKSQSFASGGAHEICVRDLKGHYKMLDAKGVVYTGCDVATCHRLHYDRIPAGFDVETAVTAAQKSCFPTSAGVKLAALIRADSTKFK